MIIEQNDKFYLTSQAYVVSSPSDLPREMASEWSNRSMNEGFLWIAGRYVQANNENKNGHFWNYDDLRSGEGSVKYTPLNVAHDWDRPVGTFVETKIVHREDRDSGSDRLLPEIQALSVVWAFNFPQVAAAAKAAHEAKQLWYSMECISENVQCMTCENVYPYRSAAHEVCEHLATKAAAKRFINPIFLGGALIFPPQKPAWKDADVTEVARQLTHEYASRKQNLIPSDVDEWNDLMARVMSVPTN